MTAVERAKPHTGNLKPAPSRYLLVKSFERHLRAERKSPRTVEHYIGATRQFVEYCIAENLPAPEHVSREHVEMWMESLHERYAPASVRNRYLGLRAFYDWLKAENEIDRNPFGDLMARRIRPPEMEERPKDVLTAEEVSQLFKYLRRKRMWKEAVVVALLYDGGLRAGEVCRSRVDDYDETSGVLVVEKSKGKRIRYVQLDPETMSYIDKYHRRGRVASEYLVCGQRGPFQREGIYRLVRRVAEAAGIAKGRTIGAHDLRHTSASHMAATGELSEADAMEIYGWKDPDMWRHYTDQARRQAAMQAKSKVGLMRRLRD